MFFYVPATLKLTCKNLNNHGFWTKIGPDKINSHLSYLFDNLIINNQNYRNNNPKHFATDEPLE